LNLQNILYNSQSTFSFCLYLVCQTCPFLLTITGMFLYWKQELTILTKQIEKKLNVRCKLYRIFCRFKWRTTKQFYWCRSYALQILIYWIVLLQQVHIFGISSKYFSRERKQLCVFRVFMKRNGECFCFWKRNYETPDLLTTAFDRCYSYSWTFIALQCNGGLIAEHDYTWYPSTTMKCNDIFVRTWKH